MRAISDTYYLHALNLLPQFGPKRLALLYSYFGAFQKAFQARPADLKKAGIGQAAINAWFKLKPAINLRQERQLLRAQNIKVLSFNDASYPRLLAGIPNPPVILYYKGAIRTANELCLAVVGSRKITVYGRSVMPQLLLPLVHNKMTIVSGLAYGVDAQAHQLALDNGGATIAVLGCGLDEASLYPPDHAYMAQRIIEGGGALISEYVPGTAALRQNFVARNRIISGLSKATIVVECDVKSGALITARHALNQDRLLYAVPGPIYSVQSRGPNGLLKQGAQCITQAEDIFEGLNIKTTDEQLPEDLPPLSDDEQKLLEQLAAGPKTLNEIIKLSGMEAGLVTANLTFLEMKGRIKHLGSGQYSKLR